MLSPDIPRNEVVRLQSLHDLQILDTSSEQEFDSLVKAAAAVCGTPISLISLVDEDRQWFKANVGLEGTTETSRDTSICAHVINNDGITVIEDLSATPDFSDNPLVINDPNIRFYAGATLRLSNGAAVGTLCVIDHKPGSLTEQQREVLTHLATAVVTALEGRRARMARRVNGTAAAQALVVLKQSIDAIVVYDIKGTVIQCNIAAEKLFGYREKELRGKFIGRIIPVSKKDEAASFRKDVENNLEGIRIKTTRLHKSGREFDVSVTVTPILDAHQQINGYISTTKDISSEVSAAAKLRESEVRFKELNESVPVGVYAMNAEGVCNYTNSRWQEIFGISDGRNWSESVHPDDAAFVTDATMECLSEGRDVDLSFRVVRPEGDVRQVRTRVRPLRDEAENITGFVGSIEDETDVRRTEAALTNAHQRMNIAAEAGGIGIFEFDPRTGVSSWDQRMFDLHGLVNNDTPVLSTRWLHRLHVDDQEKCKQAVVDALTSTEFQRDYQSEYRVVEEDGGIRYLRLSARITRNHKGLATRVVGVSWDVSAMHELTEELTKQHELSRITLESIGDAVITTDAAGIVTWLNPVAETMTGFPVDQARGRPLQDVFEIVDENSGAPLINSVEDCLKSGEVVRLHEHATLISSDGTEYGIEDTAAPIRNEDGELYGTVLAFHDVTQSRKLASEMRFRASHDTLTGLLKREEFEQRLQRCLDQSKLESNTHALMYIDLDQFKLVNDACGHAGGDKFLQQVTKILKDTIRSRDTLARLGGDEFGLILEHCNPDQAQRLAQKICRLLDQSRFQHDQKSFRIGASLGLVIVDDRWDNITALMQAADTSCFAAKDAGRNRVHQWFDSDSAMQARQGEMQWATRLERALDENRFVLYAQRIFPIDSADFGVRAEALLRMPDGDGNMILPGAFLPAAERFHLCSRIDRWVLNEVLTSLEDDENWQKIDNLSVNISGQSIGDQKFHADILVMLTNTRPDICQRLCLEITETSAVTNISEASAFIEQVQALGVVVALDDFGAGASSFGYLKSMPVDFLKIDGQYVQRLIDNPLDDVAVRCFVDVAEVVGVKTVAEYVDNEAVLSRLKEIHVDYAQGFLLHKPEPLELLFERNQPTLMST